MSENKFTPGPWELITDEEEMYYAGGRLPFVKVSEKRHILVEGRNFEEAVANAKLVTVAPELLESNEWLLEAINLAMKGKPIRDLDERILFAQRTIAKAKGES